MTYGLAPLATDADAPLPSGIAYEETTEPHEGCPRDGMIAVEIDDYTGATVDRCTRCDYRRIIGAYRPGVVPTPEAPARKPMGMNAPKVAPPADDGAPHLLCACQCGRSLPLYRKTYATQACREKVEAARLAARLGAGPDVVRLCRCGCGVVLNKHQARYASRGCVGRARHLRAAGKRLATCSDCGGSFEQPRRVDASPRCQPCRIAERRRMDAAYRRHVNERAARRLALAAQREAA